MSWEVTVEQPSVRTTGDPRLARYVNLLEAHEAARSRDTALRDRIGDARRPGAAAAVRRRRATTRERPSCSGPSSPPYSTGPARRMDPAEIDRYLTRIEEL